jgi:hypothetical protein
MTNIPQEQPSSETPPGDQSVPNYSRINQRIKYSLRDELHTHKDRAPIIPLIEEQPDAGSVQALINYWSNMWIAEAEPGEQTAALPYYYPSADRVTQNGESVAERSILGVDYFENLQQQITSKEQGGSLEILAPEHQEILLAKRINGIKTVPVDAVVTEQSEESGAQDKHNFNPRNFDSSQVTAVQTGEQVRVLAKASFKDPLNVDEVDYLFVMHDRGNFGWVKEEDYLTSGSVELTAAAMEAEGYSLGFVDVPLLEIDDAQEELDLITDTSSVGGLRTPRGMNIGTPVWVKEGEDGKLKVNLPAADGLETKDFAVDREHVHIGIKERDSESAITDFMKLEGQVYGWGGNPVWGSESNSFLYGLADCSGMISNVMRMYGYKLPNNTVSIAVMGDKLAGDLNSGQVLTDEEIEDLDYEPGFTFFISRTHMAVVISRPGEKPVRLLHAHYRPRFHFDTSGEQHFDAGEYDPLEIDRVVITDATLLRKPDGTFLESIPDYIDPNHPEYMENMSQNHLPFLRNRLPVVAVKI